MPASLLVVVSYLAGSVWGPSTSFAPLPDLLGCTRIRAAVAANIQKVARSNSTAAVDVVAGGEDVVVRAGVTGRELARLSCLSGDGG